jgi:hypothetical protein
LYFYRIILMEEERKRGRDLKVPKKEVEGP